MAGTLGGCGSEERPHQVTEIAETGELNLPLETFGQSGAHYLLLNARFEIDSVHTGRNVTTLFSDDDVFSSELSTELDAGNYMIHLLPGWRIEKLSDGGPTGAGGGGNIPSPVTPSPTSTAAPATSSGVAIGPVAEDSAFDDDFGPVDSVAVGSFGSFGEIQNAALDSDAIQFVSIFANQDSFTSFTFLVGDDVVSFDPGRLHIDFQVVETNPPDDNSCDVPSVAKRAALIENSDEALQFVSLRNALDAIASNGGFESSGEDIYHQIIDSYATADQGRLQDSPHCGDEMTNGEPTLNGYPIRCNRAEAQQFDNLDSWFPMAFVNRIDLAPQNGAHCGQQRMVFANDVNGRMFFIVEAQIPNPAPELGINGCLPLANFWANLTQLDVVSRGVRLTQAFLSGDPELAAAGFGPFYTALNFTVGSGQIRTNNFNDFVWTLREFKLALNDDELGAVPFPTAEAPNGQLWNDNSDLTQGPGCRDAFINQSLGQVLGDDPAQFSFVVPQECKDAESENNFGQSYPDRLNEGTSDGFRAALTNALAGTGLSADDVAARAQFAGSCIGCHNEASGRFLGTKQNGDDLFAPFSSDFVHVSESTGDCPDHQSGQCHQLSAALETLFLPHRLDVMENLVSVGLPPRCGGGGDGGVIQPPPPPPFVDAGVPTFPGADAGVDGGMAAAFEVILPEADTPTAILVANDEQAREAYGDHTIGGQSAQQTH
jgi:hypothetical protein